MSKRSRSYCFTFNNFTEEICQQIQAIDCKYLIYQREIGERGTPHLQGTICFENAKSFNACKKLFPGVSVHLEQMKGSISQSIKYCSKSETRIPGTEPFEKGTPPSQGSRTDLTELSKFICEGNQLSDVVTEFPEPFFKYHKAIITLIGMQLKPRTFRPIVYWFYGDTGTGKTWTAWNMDKGAYFKSPSHKWWDGYIGQESVIIDDYRINFCDYNYLLALLDMYPFRVEYKGGSIEMVSKRIFITAPFPPEQMWEHQIEENLAQLKRRLKYVAKFTGKGKLQVEFANPAISVENENYKLVSNI